MKGDEANTFKRSCRRSFFGVCHVIGRSTLVQVASPWIPAKYPNQTDDFAGQRFAMLTTPSSSTRDSRGPANRLTARSARGKESVGLDCPTDLYFARPDVRPMTNSAIVGKYVWSDVPAPDAETGFQTKPHSRSRAEYA